MTRTGEPEPGFRRSAAGVRSSVSDSVDALFAAFDRPGSPGVNLAVFRGAETIHRRGYGVAVIEHDIGFSADTVLRLGSTTKHMACTALLLLEAEGLLGLDDPVRRFVPELPDYGAEFTLRRLATMTAGLPDGLNLRLLAGLSETHPVTRPQIFAAQAAFDRPMRPPGEALIYSNTAYNLVSLIIERVSGVSLRRFMAARLFQPLEMDRTQLIPFDGEVIEGMASGYARSGDGGFRRVGFPIEASGDGGVVSTLADMTHWYMNYRNDRVFGPDYRARLETVGCLSDGGETDYALGITVGRYRGALKVSHAGGMPGFLCDFVFFPEADAGFVLFSNVSDPTILGLGDRLADLLLFDGAPDGAGARGRDPVDAGPPLGLYADPDAGEIIALRSEAGRLVCVHLGVDHFMEPAGAQHWRTTRRGGALQLAWRAETEELRLGLDAGPEVLCRPVTLQPPSIELSAAYAGAYECRALGEFVRIRLSEDELVMETGSPLRPLVWRRMLHAGGDLCVCLVDGEPSPTNVVCRFRRAAGGAVVGLELSLNRVLRIAFRKVEIRAVKEDALPS